MGLYHNFLSVSGRFAKEAFEKARSLSRPIVSGITQVAEKVRKAASALSVVPAVGAVAATVLSVSSAVVAVGSVISELLGPEPTPPAPQRQWETETMIFDGSREMDRAFDRDGDIGMPQVAAPPTVSRPVFDKPSVMTYAGRPIAPLRGRQVYPTLRLDPPGFMMFDRDAEVQYDRPIDTRNAKRFQVTSVA